MNLPTLTVDTNVLFMYWVKDPAKEQVIETLLRLAKEGRVDLAITARIHEDIPLLPLSDRINELPELSITKTNTAARWNLSAWDRDMWGDKEFVDFYPTALTLAEECLRAKKSKKKDPLDWKDWDHLHAHYLLKRDFFLTWDTGILCLAERLHTEFGIVIMTPEQYSNTLKIGGSA